MEDRIEIVDKAVGSEVSERELLLDEEGGYVQAAQFPGTVRGSWRKIVLLTTTLDADAAFHQAMRIVRKRRGLT